jgi:hypothetical protein
MYKLRRLHLDTIGVRDNRFASLTIEPVDLAGDPVDTLVWMRNGSGKTTILALLAAHILSRRRDFLAARKKKRKDDVVRTLEDLVQGRDTAHVAAEWQAPDGALLATGAVWEWTNKRRPLDYNSSAGAAKLKHLFWALRPEPTLEAASFDELPFTSRTRGQVDLAGFEQHVRSLAASGVDAVTTRDIETWHRVLRDRGFDADLYRYFVAVNAIEGGLDALFTNIRTGNDFARFLLGFVTDAERAESVRDLLRDVAGELTLRPAYRVEREFCVNAQPHLTELASAHEQVLRADRDRKAADLAAAEHRQGLLLAAQAAEQDAARAAAEFTAAEDERLRTRQATDAARRRRDELLRIAALRWHDDAQAEQQDSEDALAEARLQERAWSAVEDLLLLRRRAVEASAHHEAMAAARAEAEPLLAQADQAAADLVAAYDAELGAGANRERHLGGLIGDEMSRREAARARATKAAREHAALDQEAVGLHQRVADLQGKHDRAVASGLLAADADPDLAVEQASGTLTGLRNDLAGADREVEAAKKERQATVKELAYAREQLAGKQQAVREARAVLESLERQAVPLDESELVAQLAQADDVHALADAARLAGLANGRVADADAKLVERAVDASADQLAVTALETTHLLPVRPAVRQVLATLEEADVPAVAGWTYLETHVAAADAAAVIATLPEVCNGVVVYGDPAEAADAAAGLTLDDPVVLAPAAVFADPLGADTSTWVVAGPIAARYDSTAGALELDRRRARLGQHDQASAALRDKRDAWSRLAADLRALAAAVEARGGIELVRFSLEVADAAAATAEATEAEAASACDAVELRLTDAQERHRRLDREANREASRLQLLSELAADLRELAPARVRLADIPRLRQAAADRERTAAAEANAAEARVRSLGEDLAVLRSKMAEWRAVRDAVTTSGTRKGQAPAGGLDAARHRYDHARRLVVEAFDEAELRRRLNDLDKAVEEASSAWGQHAADARMRAEELAATPGAAEPTLRARAREHAQQAVMTANTRHTLAGKDLEAAEQAVVARSPTNRLRHADLPQEPATRAEAEAAASTEDATAARLQEQVRMLEQRAASLKEDRDGAVSRAKQFALLADNFDEWKHIPASTSAGLPVDPDAAKEQADGTRKAARAAASRHVNAQSERSRLFDQLRTWSADDRFARSSERSQMMARLRTLFREQPVTIIAVRAAGLTSELDQRRARIDEHLAHIEQSQRNVVTRLVDLVGSALADLTRFSTLSVLPERIGPWGGHTFVDVRPRGDRPGVDQIRVRVSELVDHLVEPGTSLDMDPVELVWRATEAAVAPSGFRARILKPDPAQSTSKVDVTDMNKWSGGENLTACLVLFCVMVKLRAENRGGRRGASVVGGLVPLDNPLGKANYVPFLHLQRTVAATAGVQLLFLTGIGDLPAVRVFDSVVACSKRNVKDGEGAYVTLDGANSDQADPAQAQEVDGARLVRQS